MKTDSNSSLQAGDNARWGRLLAIVAVWLALGGWFLVITGMAFPLWALSFCSALAAVVLRPSRWVIFLSLFATASTWGVVVVFLVFPS